MKLTKPQAYVLQTCVNHGGVLEVGGLDGANVKRSVVNRCIDRALLKLSNNAKGYSLTDAGRAALASHIG